MKRETMTTRVELCEDGKYRWIYEMSLFKNPTIFFLIWKIFFFIFLAIFAFIFIADVKWGVERILNDLKFCGFFLIGMTVVTWLGYSLYAAMTGGKYIVEFEMDEKGVEHRQIASQAAKAKKIGKATMIAGFASGRLSTVGAGINAARTEMYSDFEKTKNVKAYPGRALIKVNGFLSHNQVYVPREDFDLVYDFIISHCPNLKK